MRAIHSLAAALSLILLAGCGQPTSSLLRSTKLADVRAGMSQLKQEQDEQQLNQAVPALVQIYRWTGDKDRRTSEVGLAALAALAALKLPDGRGGLAAAFATAGLRARLVDSTHRRYAPGSKAARPDRAPGCRPVFDLMVRYWGSYSAVQRSKVITALVRQRCTSARSWLQKRFKQDKLAWYGIMAVHSCRQLKEVAYSYRSRTDLMGRFAAAMHKLCAMDDTLANAVGQSTLKSSRGKLAKTYGAVARWPVPDSGLLAPARPEDLSALPGVTRKLRLAGEDVVHFTKEAAQALCAVDSPKLQKSLWHGFSLRSGLLGRLLVNGQIRALDCLGAQGACALKPLCKKEGRCTDGDGSKCVASSDDDCARSAACSQQGRCKVGDRLCVAKGDDDCAGSTGCTHGGQCKVNQGRCVATDHKQCKKAPACRQEGRCKVAPDGRCHAATKADCQQAEACIGQGRCKAVNGACVK